MKFIELTETDQNHSTKITVNTDHISYVMKLGDRSSILLQGNTFIILMESYETVLELLKGGDTNG